MKKEHKGTTVLYRVFVYVALITLAISIIVPVGWVFMASLKQNSEFLGADVIHGHCRSSFLYRTSRLLSSNPIWVRSC